MASIGARPGPAVARVRSRPVGDARALGDQVAAWFTHHHQALNVKYIIWWGEIIDYRDARPAWGPCKKPGSSCATLHFDHVHVSFTA